MAADLAALRERLGAKSGQDDTLLEWALAAAQSWVFDRVFLASQDLPEVREAILITASRLYKRRTSPEGVAGFGEQGDVIRITSRDPDVAALLERHTDTARTVGFA